jgi:hypothetical protein
VPVAAAGDDQAAFADHDDELGAFSLVMGAAGNSLA